MNENRASDGGEEHHHISHQPCADWMQAIDDRAEQEEYADLYAVAQGHDVAVGRQVDLERLLAVQKQKIAEWTKAADEAEGKQVIFPVVRQRITFARVT